ncbi:MAG TPA: hypothetical protein ENN41_10550 [Sediminispirochaeta sp.]|nr:hypothetical protein [Sediminispirochaeta sp.]
MKKIIEILRENNLEELSQTQLDRLKASEREKIEKDSTRLYTRSLYTREGILYFVAKEDGEKSLYLCSHRVLPEDFTGQVEQFGDLFLKKAPFSTDNAATLRTVFPFTAPVSLREKRTTIGCGDRLGIASAAHIRAIRKYQAYPVLAQQSIRELNFTNRTFKRIVADAGFQVFQEGYEDGWGADGDHLKSIEDVDTALQAGMPMITLDLTETLHPEAVRWDEPKIEEEFGELPQAVRKHIDQEYRDLVFENRGVTVRLPRLEARRCALMYLDALDFAALMDRHIREHRGEAYDLEISIDETSTATLPGHHLFIIRELRRRGVTVNSLAPRFIGEFQKGVDYIGNLEEFEGQFAVHCAIAQAHGDYKISIHSGSDKFSVYPAIGRYTHHRLHLKTAGTSWVEAIRTIARTEPELYRRMHKKAQDFFPEALKSYHISADISGLPDINTLRDSQLEEYLDISESRQMLHISYGGLLRDSEIRGPFFKALSDHEELHETIIRKHMEKHLSKLGVKKR